MRQDRLFFVPEAHAELEVSVDPLGLAVWVALVAGLVLFLVRRRRR